MASADNSSATSGGQAQVEQISSGSTPIYSLYASDNPCTLITSVMFNGDNYNEWSTELTNALKAKRKLGFIDDTIQKPPITDPNFELWSSVNSMIVGWIRSSIEARVRSTVTFITDSNKLWDNLKKRFSVGNKVQIHFLKEQLARCRQDGHTVMDYYGRLAKLWEELDTYKPLPPCTCSAAAIHETEREEEKVHQFLMDLDEVRFGGICQGIIASDSHVDLGEAYAKVIREEQRLASAKERETQQNVVGLLIINVKSIVYSLYRSLNLYYHDEHWYKNALPSLALLVSQVKSKVIVYSHDISNLYPLLLCRPYIVVRKRIITSK